MDGFHTQALNGLGNNPIAYWGSFQCNATSNPLSSTFLGPPGLKAFTVVYSATGVFTVTLPAGLGLPSQPHSIIVSKGGTALADWFDVMTIGDSTLNAAARSFVIQAHRAGTGQAPAATAGNRIFFFIVTNNSTGA